MHLDLTRRALMDLTKNYKKGLLACLLTSLQYLILVQFYIMPILQRRLYHMLECDHLTNF